MKRMNLISVAILLAATSVARADLSRAERIVASSVAHARYSAEVAPAPLPGLVDLEGVIYRHGVDVETSAVTSRSTEFTGNVIQAPPAPGSAALFMWAVGGLGVWHLGRSARKIHFGDLPEWYHAGGPVQVGHATPLDLEFSTNALPVCAFAVPAGPQPILLRSWREAPLRVDSQQFLRAVEPRGPPRF